MFIKDESVFWNKGIGKFIIVEGLYKIMNRCIDEFLVVYDDSYK